MEDKRLEKRKEFLNPVKDGRVKREKYMVELRKKRKQDMFRAKRRIRVSTGEESPHMKVDDDGTIEKVGKLAEYIQDYAEILQTICPILFEKEADLSDKLKEVKKLLGMDCHDRKTYIALCSYLRHLSSKDPDKYAVFIIREELYPQIMKIASAHHVLDLMLEITWILTNLSSCEDKNITEYLCGEEFGLIKYCHAMVGQEDLKIVEHAIWILNNLMAGDDAPFEQIFGTGSGLFEAIEKLCDRSQIPLCMLRVMAWSISNMAKCKTRSSEFIVALIEICGTTLFCQDTKTQVDSCYCLKHLTDIEEEDKEQEADKLKSICESGIIPKLSSFLELGHPCFTIALRTLGNLSAVDCLNTQKQILSEGFFCKAAELYCLPTIYPITVKELFWISSNLISGSEQFACEFYSSALFSIVYKYIKENPMSDVMREAYWCMNNFVEKIDSATRMELIQHKEYHIIPLFIHILKEAIAFGPNVEHILMSIDFLLRTCKHFHDEDEHHPLFQFQDHGGIELLDSLSSSINVTVFTLSQRLLKTYYPNNDEYDGKNTQISRDDLEF
ncbi:unnamed protein product [Moneuplotes crassus]|uniref:IBB domain-containing protein n=2 Tax=Euplotes crassus TaxID=5936 RepID=A0AAD1UA39_EUPCR|nr:unnamed protein product [Moneuplotes crassus]